MVVWETFLPTDHGASFRLDPSVTDFQNEKGYWGSPPSSCHHRRHGPQPVDWSPGEWVWQRPGREGRRELMIYRLVNQTALIEPHHISFIARVGKKVIQIVHARL